MKSKQINIRFEPEFEEAVKVAAGERGVSFSEALRAGARLWLEQATGQTPEWRQSGGNLPANPEAEGLKNIVEEMHRSAEQRIAETEKVVKRCSRGCDIVVLSPAVKRCRLCNGELVADAA